MITYSEIHKWDNLLLAHRYASKGKRGKKAAASFEFKLEDNLLSIQDDLFHKTYQPSGYSNFYIHEPKRRLISAAIFRDRVVHHALCNIISPFKKSAIYWEDGKSDKAILQYNILLLQGEFRIAVRLRQTQLN